jgi:excinuclease ABC subunit C
VQKHLADKLQQLPKTPGVYFHKNAAGEVIYVGKAAVLKNRVRQYFQASRNRDAKTEALVAEIADVEWMEVESEIEALFLEAEMVKRYMPPYNILLRDDKSNSYVRIDMQHEYPTVTLTRRPLDDGATYFGPYLNGFALRRALKYLRKIFPYSTHTVLPKRACLQYHLGLCPGPETGELDAALYKKNLKQLILYLQGKRVMLANELEKEMKHYSKNAQFEDAAKARDRLLALRNLNKQIIFSDREFMDLSKDHALNDLAELLGLYEPAKAQQADEDRVLRLPKRIEGYDISHMQGTDTVASMVVFTNGVADKGAYRKFKMRIPGNDDFAHMNEVISRRFAEKHLKSWGRPDVLLIDGGKGQLGAAIQALKARGLEIPAFGLAKQYEEIIVSKSWPAVQVKADTVQKLQGVILETDDFLAINLPNNSHIVKLLQRIRDESHRFAVSYHSTLKVKRQTASLLDEIPTIGPETRKKLIRTFGSFRGVVQARDFELEKVVGVKKAAILKQYLRPYKKGTKD